MDLTFIRQAAQAAPIELRHHAAKEALQRCLLACLEEKGLLRDVAFIGGTALRILHGLPRYSEDLDFMWINALSEVDLKKWTGTLSKAFTGSGITVHVDKKGPEKVDALVEKRSATIYFVATTEAFRTFAREGLQISFEIDLNPPSHFEKQSMPMAVAETTVQIPSLTLPSLMAGKLHILLTRKDREKGRDWFDYAWYRERQVSPNVEQLASAIAQTARGPDAQYWMSYLRERTSKVNWDNVRSDVRTFLENRKDVEKLNEHTISAVTPWPDFEAITAELARSGSQHPLLASANPVVADIEQAAMEGIEAAIDARSAIQAVRPPPPSAAPEVG
jgi:predicted nucleotidyltransferase component of viral defense system